MEAFAPQLRGAHGVSFIASTSANWAPGGSEDIPVLTILVSDPSHDTFSSKRGMQLVREDNMQDGVNKQMIRSLALANGLDLPEERLERVLEQYKAYLELLARLDSFALDMTAEPATTFSLTQDESVGRLAWLPGNLS